MLARQEHHREIETVADVELIVLAAQRVDVASQCPRVRRERFEFARLLARVGGDAVIAERNLRVDGDDPFVRQMHDDVGTEAASFVGQERLLNVEVAQLAHASQLDAAFEGVFSPRATNRRRCKRIGESRCLTLRALLCDEQRTDLFLQSAVRFVARVLALLQFAGIAAEHVAQRLQHRVDLGFLRVERRGQLAF